MKCRMMMIIVVVVLFLPFNTACSTNVSAGDSSGSSNNDPSDIEMIFIEGGTFIMGCTPDQGGECESIEFPAHQVTLSDFYIGKYEVTQAQWKAVMGEHNNPSEFKGDDLPMEMVTRYDVLEFIERLNRKTGMNYRLPTEAEWEYAARGGNQSRGYKYSGSNDVNEVAWYTDNSGFSTHPVGTKLPNELGIYDMSGNVFERTNDGFTQYSSTAQTNPGSPTGSHHIIRGGGWNANAEQSYSVRVTNRTSNVPDFRCNRLGFRLVVGSFNQQMAVDNRFSDNEPTTGDVDGTTYDDNSLMLSKKAASSPPEYIVYYEISVPEQLNNIRTNLSGSYRLTADISLTSYDNWMPIGSPFEPFTGRINGNGYKITNLKIDRSTEESVGLFGFVKGGVISNLALENIAVVGRAGVGGIAGHITDGTLVANSYTTGSVSSMGGFSGGIVGQAVASTITNSYSKANINSTPASFSAKNSVVPGPGPSGGIAGSLVDSTVSNSYSAGNVITINHAGGIAGLTVGSTIINSYSTGNVNASNGPAGGIAGRISSGTISNCYSTGLVNIPVIIGQQLNSRGGGILGEIAGSSVTQPPVMVKNCAAINTAINATNSAGRILGGIQGMHNFAVQNNFALEVMLAVGSANFINYSDARFNGASKTDARLKEQSTYSGDAVGGADGGLGWKFGSDDDSPWTMPIGGGYPILYWQ